MGSPNHLQPRIHHPRVQTIQKAHKNPKPQYRAASAEVTLPGSFEPVALTGSRLFLLVRESHWFAGLDRGTISAILPTAS
jgi:hypothetical protein